MSLINDATNFWAKVWAFLNTQLLNLLEHQIF